MAAGGLGESIAEAVGALANAATYINAGKRQKRERLGDRYRLTDFLYEDNTSLFVIGGGVIILVVIMIAIARSK